MQPACLFGLMQNSQNVASSAASIAVITVLRSSVALCAWGAFLACLSPDSCFFAFKLFSKFLSNDTRASVATFWRAVGALVATACLALLAASGALAQADVGSRGSGKEEIECRLQLKVHFQDSRIVGSLATVLIVLYVEQIWNRCLCAFAHSRMPRLMQRTWSAIKVASLWMLLSRPSLLATRLALHLTVNWFVRDSSSLPRIRDHLLANCLHLAAASFCLHTAYTSYTHHGSKCETRLGSALVFWIAILDAVRWIGSGRQCRSRLRS